VIRWKDARWWTQMCVMMLGAEALKSEKGRSGDELSVNRERELAI
jgi:hypothetical protein